jgi:hypothetical protein
VGKELLELSELLVAALSITYAQPLFSYLLFIHSISCASS